MHRRTLATTIVAAEVGLDQLSKHWAQRRLDGGRVIEIVPTLELDLTYNSGFSFGTGAGSGRLIGVLVVALVSWLGFMFWRETTPRRRVLYAVILGGALGNLGDRLLRADDGLLSGSVVDFIDVTWYAVFNLADVFVVCGAVAFALLEWRRPPHSEANGADAPDRRPVGPGASTGGTSGEEWAPRDTRHPDAGRDCDS